MKNVDSSTKTGQITRYFGVGAFEFRPKRKIPYKITAREHVQILESGLRELNSLSDLLIDFESSMDSEIVIDEKIPPFEDGYLFPGLPYGEIDFSLFIPKRIQKELAFMGEVDTGTEKFRVHVKYAFHGPLVFIESEKADTECDPSQAVEIVRKYLSRELAKSDKISFCALGPSPFHMDFFVKELNLDVENDVIEFNRTPMKGYDRVDIDVGWSLKEEQALHRIYFELSYELDIYYRLEAQRVIYSEAWSSLEDEWNQLRELIESKTNFFNVKRKIERHKRAADLVTAAFTFSAGESFARQNAENLVNSVYSRGFKSYFQDHTGRELKNAFPGYPVQSLIDWATHVHNSSFKLAEITTVLASALLGGFVGALVTATLAISSPSGSEPIDEAVPSVKLEGK